MTEQNNMVINTSVKNRGIYNVSYFPALYETIRDHMYIILFCRITLRLKFLLDDIQLNTFIHKIIMLLYIFSPELLLTQSPLQPIPDQAK